jgi:hypothetical protein
MKKRLSVMGMTLLVGITGFSSIVLADDDATSLMEMFSKGKVDGSLKSYFFAQTFEGSTSDSQIWVNGGHLGYTTGKFYGVSLGGTFQASLVGSINDDNNVTAGSMDADGAVLSQAYLQYELYKTRFKGGRQYYSSPLVAGSGSRLIKEAFELYSLTNTDIPDTEITAGWVNKYGTRTDKSNYGDNAFVDYETNGSGTPGDFYDVGDDGMWMLYLKNASLKNLAIQAQYANVVDEVQGFYADAKYSFENDYKPYVGAQFFYSDWNASADESNELIGLTAGATFVGVDVFAGYTTTGGSADETRVFRGLGQGAYYNYTTTTKTAGALAFEADTNAYQVGVGYKFAALTSKLRYTKFDRNITDGDLDEYTLNLEYKFGGKFENLSASVDFSVLDYENDGKDATDLRTRLIYSF